MTGRAKTKNSEAKAETLASLLVGVVATPFDTPTVPGAALRAVDP